MNWDSQGFQTAPAEAEPLSTPGHGVAGVAPSPEEETAEVAHRKKDEVAKDLAVAQQANPDHEGEGDAGEKRDGKQGQAPKRTAAGEHGEQCPRKHKGEGQAQIPEAAGIACRAGPAKLVRDEAPERVGGDGGGDDFGDELNAVAGAMEARAEFIVVGQLVDQGFEATEGGERRFCGGERGT